MFEIKPCAVKVYYDGQEYPRETIELSYQETAPERAEVWGVYSGKAGNYDWLCDCKDEETAKTIAYGLELLSTLNDHFSKPGRED